MTRYRLNTESWCVGGWRRVLEGRGGTQTDDPPPLFRGDRVKNGTREGGQAELSVLIPRGFESSPTSLFSCMEGLRDSGPCRCVRQWLGRGVEFSLEGIIFHFLRVRLGFY